MKTIGTFDAKTHLSDLLDQVARGETFVITKRGKPVATLAPAKKSTPGKSFYESLAAYRKQRPASFKPLTVEEIIAFKNEGRR